MDDKKNIPEHVAIIMDGNGRWARSRSLPNIAGHREGVKSVKEVLEAAKESGVKILTLYTFSTENWKRPRPEVEGLFRLLEEYLDKEADKLKQNNIRLSVIGRIDQIPAQVKNKIVKVMSDTANNTALILNLALNYGGRLEIVDAVRAMSKDALDGKLKIDEIDDKIVSSYLYTKDLPDPDLLIRTSGEFRVSNFLLWQIAYSEIYVTDILWPDFKKADFLRAVEDYQKRERRFGR